MVLAALLLGACADNSTNTFAGASDPVVDSERCRTAVSEQLAREDASLGVSSDVQKAAFVQRYRFCMAERGYTLDASVTP